MSSKIPYPGAEDLFPHVAQLVDPGSEVDGEMVTSLKVFGLLLAPTAEEFLAVWAEQEHATSDGVVSGKLLFPPEWEQGAKRRSKELQARYDSSHLLDILRGLHRDYGVFPQGVAS